MSRAWQEQPDGIAQYVGAKTTSVMDTVVVMRNAGRTMVLGDMAKLGAVNFLATWSNPFVTLCRASRVEKAGGLVVHVHYRL